MIKTVQWVCCIRVVSSMVILQSDEISCSDTTRSCVEVFTNIDLHQNYISSVFTFGFCFERGPGVDVALDVAALKSNGKLNPKISNEIPLNLVGIETHRLVPMKTCPLELCEVEGRNSLNGTDYDAYNNNYQHWVESAIKAIGLISARPNPTEYDSIEREALFILFSTPIHDVVLGDADHFKRLHFALVAIFKDDSVRTLEALKIDGKLTQTFSKEMPSKVRVTKIQRLGSMITSPFKLREVAERNSLNDTDYHAVKNNCLHWVKAVIKDIGLNLAKSLPYEFDHPQRQAQFFLHSRLLDYEDVVSDIGYYLKMQHWALVAVFEDESVRTMEAFNSDRTLTPKYLKQRPSDVDVTKIRHIGSMEISPYTLREVARKNSLNGTDYDAIENNGEHWAKAAIKAICLNSTRALLDECDSTVREAQFFLYSREIRDDVLCHSDHLEMQQWGLVALFKDGSVRTLEATVSNGKLIPVFSKERPYQVPGMKIYGLGTIQTSPYALRLVTLSNELNGKDYSVFYSNGQNWVKAAAKAISIDLSKAVEKHKTIGNLNKFQILNRFSRAIFRSSDITDDNIDIKSLMEGYITVPSYIKKMTEGYWSSDPFYVEVHLLD